MKNRTRHLSGAFVLVPAAAMLAACTTGAPSRKPATVVPTQPSLATYGCDGESRIVIENAGETVRVSVADAEPVELAAAPPGQRSRYGADGYALVLDERDALWMKAGKTPLTCRR